MSKPRRAIETNFDDATDEVFDFDTAPTARYAVLEDDVEADESRAAAFFQSRGGRLLIPGVAAAMLVGGVAFAMGGSGSDEAEVAVPADISSARESERPTRSSERPTPQSQTPSEAASASATPSAEASQKATAKVKAQAKLSAKKSPLPEPSESKATFTPKAEASASSSASASATNDTPSAPSSSSASPSGSASSASAKAGTSSSDAVKSSSGSSTSGSGSSASSKATSSSKPSPSAKQSSGSSGNGSIANCPKPTNGIGPAVVPVWEASCKNFPDIKSYGGNRPGDSGYHGSGRALDIMVSGPRGWEIAEYMRANASRLGVTEVIYEQKIWTTQRSSEGWRPMSDRGSVTANHYDHVHISVG